MEQHPRALRLPTLRQPTIGELGTIAETRLLISFAGLELASRAGMLWCGKLHDGNEHVSAWILTDAARRSAQARRMDGKRWVGIDAKAKTLPGSQASWPIGIAAASSKPFIALCEGGPDTLAAWTLAWWHGMHFEIAPVCMAGAGNAIHAAALSSFEGKGVWTFPHKDEAGEKAASRWTKQLIEAGALWVRPFDVGASKDLNDWISGLSASIGGDE